MMIFHSDGMGMTNIGSVKFVEVFGRYIMVHYLDGTTKAIGAYASEERAVEVIKGMPKLLNSYTETGYIELPER